MSCQIYTGSSTIETAVWPSVETPGSTRAIVGPVHGRQRSSGGDIEGRLAEVSANAEARLAQVREEAFAAGQRAATASVEPVIERLAKSLESLAEVRAQLRKQAETDLVKLTIAIARRVLRRELSVDPDALQGIIAAALDRLQVRDISKVRLHPSQEGPVRRHLENAGVTAIEIVADSSLAAGDLLFEASRGTFDASIDSQLREIERGFADTLPR